MAFLIRIGQFLLGFGSVVLALIFAYYVLKLLARLVLDWLGIEFSDLKDWIKSMLPRRKTK